MSDRLTRLNKNWSTLPLAPRFLISGGLVALAAMVLCGLLTTTVVTKAVLALRGDIVAAIAQNILAPPVQGLGPDGTVDSQLLDDLDAIMSDQIFAAEFPFLDLWGPDGTILYSNSPGVLLKRVTPPPGVQRALAGETSVDFPDVNSADYLQHRFTTDFVEIYFALRNRDTNEIVAVAQLREVTTSLKRDLWVLTLSSWGAVALIATVVMVALFSTVLEGSRKIERQARMLTKRLGQSHARATHQRALEAEVQRVSQSVTEMMDVHLRTVGADLHDGPVQSIAFAMLKLNQIRRLSRLAERDVVVSEVESILGGAVSEIRAISLALVLLEVEGLDLAEVIDRAVEQHVGRTKCSISVNCVVEPLRVLPEVAVCVFRFIQEGLSNAFQHGLHEGQTLSAAMQGAVLKLTITNNYVARETIADHLGIGLYGLRARVRSIGGNFAFVQSDGQTRIEMWVRIV